MDDVEEPARIEVQDIEGGEEGFPRTSRTAHECLPRPHHSDPVQLLEGLPLHIVRLDSGICDIIVHIPPLDRIVEFRFILFDQLLRERQCPLPQPLKFLLCGIICLLLRGIDYGDVPFYIFEERVNGNIGRTNQ